MYHAGLLGAQSVTTLTRGDHMSDYLFRATEELLQQARAKQVDVRHSLDESQRQAGRELVAGTSSRLVERLTRSREEVSPVRGELADWSAEAVQAHHLDQVRQHFESDRIPVALL